MHGAATVIVKNPSKGPISPITLAQAGALAVCRSSAWDAKLVISAWWVHHEQVPPLILFLSWYFLKTTTTTTTGFLSCLLPCLLGLENSSYRWVFNHRIFYGQRKEELSSTQPTCYGFWHHVSTWWHLHRKSSWRKKVFPSPIFFLETVASPFFVNSISRVKLEESEIRAATDGLSIDHEKYGLKVEDFVRTSLFLFLCECEKEQQYQHKFSSRRRSSRWSEIRSRKG